MKKNRNRSWQNMASFIKVYRLTMVFLLTVICLLMSFGYSGATAEIDKEINRSDYAYIGDDYYGIDRAAKSVFYIETDIYRDGKQYLRSGSGFIMFNERLLITNQHVIDGASYLRIIDDDGKQYKIDQVVISDDEHDIAILLFPEGKNYEPLDYDTSFDMLKRGQPVITIGSPEGMRGTVSDGIISGFQQFKGEDISYIQISAPISHGSSGGCLLNGDLKVIGVNSSGLDEGQNLNFAIPISIVEQLYLQWNKVDTIPLGSDVSWDTVGHGLHSRISGSLEKLQIQGGSSGNTGSTQTKSPVEPVANLDVIWDSSISRYMLTINGGTLYWSNTVDAAAKFCNQNGIMMSQFENGNGKEDAFSDQRITFGGVLEVCQFYVRTGFTGDMNQIDIYIKNNMTDLSEVIKSASDTYQKLLRILDSPAKDIVIYTDGKSIEVKTNDLTEAIKQMSQQKGSYSTLAIMFNNIHLYIGYNEFDDGRSYDVEITLVPW